MNILRYLPSSSALALSFVCTAQGAIHQAPLASETIEPLFVHALGVPLEVDEDRPEIVTIGAIYLRTDLLVNGAQSQSGRFTFELFDGEPHVVVFKESFHSLTGSWIWAGVIDGCEQGYLALAVHEDSAVGMIEFDDKRYLIEPVHSELGVHRLMGIDSSAFGSCGLGPQHHVASRQEATLANSVSLEMNYSDVLVAFTPAVSSTMGTNGAIALANSAVWYTNLAYANSEIPLELRLVGAQETIQAGDGDQSGMLARLRSLSDGWYDEIPVLRDELGADFVALLVAGGTNCGVAYLMSNPSASFSSSAYSVTKTTCAVSNLTFAHELGHNMGSHHDRANAGSTPAYSFSYGYRTPSPNAYRTVMAYPPGTRIGYFSNPDVTFAGYSLGIGDPANDSADNATSIGLTAPVFSQFRCGPRVETFGWSMMTSQWAELELDWTGTPLTDGSGGFDVIVRNGVPNQFGILFYGVNRTEVPFMGGNQFVGFPFSRMPVVQVSAGGGVSFDWVSHAQPAPGQPYYLQFWQRDPNNISGFNVAMSNGLRVDPCD